MLQISKPRLVSLALLPSLLSAVAIGHAASPIERSGIRGGICIVPEASDPNVLLELAASDRFIVHAFTPDETTLSTLRETIAGAGKLGRNLYLDLATPGRLPYPDHSAELIVLPDGSAFPEEEIQRVLAPVRGQAFIGDRILRKGALEGAGEWTHRFHAADNNPAATDTAFQGPSFVQFAAMPMQTSFQGTMLVANGRRIELSDWVVKKDDRANVAGILRARSLYNGLPLWERSLPKNLEPDMPIAALDGDRIYLADDSACRVLVIDAETGSDLAPLDLDPNPNLRVNWLAISDDRLFALLGQPLSTRPALHYMMGRGNRELRMEHAAAGEGLVAWDLVTGERLWHHTESATIDYRTVAVRDAHTFFYSEGTRLACLAPDGSLLWENREDEWLTKLNRPQRIRNPNHESASTLIAGPSGQVRLAIAGAPNGFFFDAQTGDLLWSDSLKAPKCVFLEHQYLTPSGTFEAATGQKIGEQGLTVEGGGCGLVTWVPGLEAGLGHVAMGVKSPCGVGAYAAGGMISFAPSQCDCWPHLRGAIGFGSGDSLLRQARENPEHPLVRSPASLPSAALQSSPGDWPHYRGDHRHLGAVQHPAPEQPSLAWHTPVAHPLHVPEGHDMQRDEWLDRPTPPVTAGGLVFQGSSDGSIRAVRIDNGSEAWTYWTGGPVLSPPLVHEGILYAGSGDGWVHALRADSGERVWKWRGAPVDRRVVVYEKLTSLWPVHAVTVVDGTLYGVAGQHMQNGSITFALDAASGEPRWTKWTEPAYDSRALFDVDEFGFGPAGQLTVLDGRLIIATYLGIPAVFEAASGSRIPPTEEYQEILGSAWKLGFRAATSGYHLTALDDRTVLVGGHPLLSNPDIRHDKSAGKFVAWQLDDAGAVPVRPVPWQGAPHSLVAPALDDSTVSLVGGIGRSGRSENATIGISLWTRESWDTEAKRAPESDDSAQIDVDPDVNSNSFRARRALQAALQAEIQNFKPSLDMAQASWRIDEADINALVLTANAVLAAHGDRSFARSRGPVEFQGWKLTAFSRDAGEPLWSLDLPGEPVFNGLAPAAGGSWLLSLKDGSLLAINP